MNVKEEDQAVDALERPSAVSLRGKVAGVVVGGLGSCAYEFVLSAPGMMQRSVPLLLLALPLMLLAIYLLLAAFALGGLLVARAFGFRVYAVYLIPVKIARTAAGGFRPTWHFYFRNLTYVNASPRAEGPIRRQLLIFCLSGPAAMLLVGLGATGAFLLGGLSLSDEFHVFLLGIGILALTLQAGTTLSNLLGGVPLAIPALWRGGPDADRICASHMRKPAFDRLYHLYNTGQRPRDWPRSLLDQALAYQDTSTLTLYASTLAMLHGIDSGDLRRAGQWWDRSYALLDGGLIVPPEVHAGTYLEGAAYVARYRGDAVAARRLLSHTNRNLVPWPDWLRGEAAVLLAEGRGDQAHQRATVALAALECGKDTGIAQAEREWLQRLLMDAQSQT